MNLPSYKDYNIPLRTRHKTPKDTEDPHQQPPNHNGNNPQQARQKVGQIHRVSDIFTLSEH